MLLGSPPDMVHRAPAHGAHIRMQNSAIYSPVRFKYYTIPFGKLQVAVGGWGRKFLLKRFEAIPHNSKCRYGERGAADAVPQPPERCLELCGIALDFFFLQFFQFPHFLFSHSFRSYFAIPPFQIKTAEHRLPYFPGNGVLLFYCVIVFNFYLWQYRIILSAAAVGAVLKP